MAVQRALLVIADIGGYTRFMKVHRVNLAHAQDIIGRLLEAVIDGASSRLKLSKLEGDAALFYAPAGANGALDVPDLMRAIHAIRRAFVHRREQLGTDRLCTCDGCTQVGMLKIKFVVHAGDVAIQKVKSFRELAGMDVILVHRMLKNTVPVAEYVLMTDDVHRDAEAAFRDHSRAIEEDFEGVGPTTLHYVDLDDVAHVDVPSLPRSFLRALWEHIKLNARSLVYILGFRKPCAVFRNMGPALGEVAATAALPSLAPPKLLAGADAEDEAPPAARAP
ncbi:MAG: DUF2652 domain-containing protein [Myxococcales bacterium]|nr:DUF2652 domain-containing protein [Myxococcales bacterium]